LTDDPKQVIPDPDCVAVRHITGVVSSVFNGQTVAMNLVTDRMGMDINGNTYPELIVAARLRFDLNVARRIRDQLDAHLTGFSSNPRADEKPN
jgi:predicted component of type VI protein secretion system